MSNRRCFVLCLIFIMLIPFSACDQNSEIPAVSSPSPSATFAPAIIADSAGSISTASAGAPQPSATYEPAPEFNANDATIMILSINDWSEPQKSSINKLTKYLHNVDLNIKFSVGTVAMDDAGHPAVLQYIQDDLAEDGLLQDAYVINAGESERLLTDGFLMNLKDKLPETAPAYYNRYKNLLKDDIYALPTYIVNRYVQEAFLCTDSDNTNADYQNISDVLTLLEKDKTKKIIYGGGIYELVDPWAFEQGYYPLSHYGMNGGVYAGYDDKNCTPVLLEEIPGFADFALRCRALLSAHQLVDYAEAFYTPGAVAESFSSAVSSEDLLGYLRAIGDRYDWFPLNWYEGKTMAYPISAGPPQLPGDKPEYEWEIVIPSHSGKAVNVMKFVEWIYLSRENYDLVNYGEAGVDYQLAGDRYIPLLNGVQAPPDQWVGGNMTTLYVNSFDNPFFNYQYARYQVNAPLNIEAVKNKYLDRIPPIWDIDRFHNPKDYAPAFLELSRDFSFSMLTQSRYNLLNGLFDPYNTDSVSVGLTKLSALNNAQILENYVKIIKSLSGGG